MYKFFLLIALCMLVLVECNPSEERERPRIARQATNPMEAGMNVAAQMAAAAAEAAKRAIDMGKSVMQGMAQGAAAGTQMIPGMGQG